MNNSSTVAMISLGCPKNLVNSEEMLALLQDAGYAFTDDLAKADAVIINTCAFIESAKTEAIEKILETASYREENPELKIIVSGCLAQRYADDIRAELPEVDGIMGTGSYSEVVSVVEAVLAGDKPTRRGAISAPLYDTPRAVSTGPNWAYLRIAEGCDNRCAYCIIPSLRGKFRSRTKESILEEARLLAASGVKELIIVAQDITRYGIDLYGKVCLTELLKELCKLDFRWVRLHYLYPELIDDELLTVMKENPKVCSYLDIPLQHINDKVNQFKKEDGNLYAIYGTPAESLCGLQIDQFRKLYGIVENVSDRPYVSNSFHCHVTEEITPIEKQNSEARFWNLSNGGKIQYVRYPISYNKEAIRTLVRRAMKLGLYEGVNLSLAYCDDCGYQQLEMDVCPKCGSTNLTKIDRMNGYLSYSRVHGESRLNDAKMAEIAERKSM